MKTLFVRALTATALLLVVRGAVAETPAGDCLQLLDVFKIEYASDPQVSPDGKQVVYVRNFMDVMKDKPRSQVWIINVDGSDHRPITNGDANASFPRWSPDGKRLLNVLNAAGKSQIHCRWMDTGQTAELTRLPSPPANPAWSPDGKAIAFVMLVEEPQKPFVELPPKPEGAEWAKPPRVMRKLTYRFDGKGYLKDGYYHLFVLPAEGGTPRQLTRGPYDHGQSLFGASGTPSWAPDSKAIVISGNRHDDAEHAVLNTEVYEVAVADGTIRALTNRDGPDDSPVLSPDGKQLTYSGYEDKRLPYQSPRLSVMNRDGTERRVLDGKQIYFQYVDQGTTKIGVINLKGEVQILAENVGGTEISRPYASGSFSVGGDGVVAFTLTSPSRPADVAVCGRPHTQPRRLTTLNDS
jgi:acylaminoacyl-peptidase